MLPEIGECGERFGIVAGIEIDITEIVGDVVPSSLAQPFARFEVSMALP